MNVFANVTLACLLLGTVSVSAVMDDAKLEDWLSGNFTAPESMSWAEIDDFKEQFGVNDDQLYRVLINIYIEARDKWSSSEPKTLEWSRMRRIIEGVITWLPKCEDSPVKNFLLEYAGFTKNDPFLRSVALLSYLRVADAEETKNALVRFLIGVERFDSQARSSVIAHATEIFREADRGKKRAIVETLWCALAQEDAKWLFRLYDGFLTQNSGLYANSAQRRHILRHLMQSRPTCKADEYALPDLEARWRVLQKQGAGANINTNLATLRDRDFNQPLPEDERIALMTPPEARHANAPQKKPPLMGRAGLYPFGGLALGAVVSLLLIRRWKTRGK